MNNEIRLERVSNRTYRRISDTATVAEPAAQHNGRSRPFGAIGRFASGVQRRRSPVVRRRG